MLMAHPAVMWGLLTGYQTLEAVHAYRGRPELQDRMAEVADALCISTGTCDVDTALVAARHQLPGARVHDDSLLTI